MNQDNNNQEIFGQKSNNANDINASQMGAVNTNMNTYLSNGNVQSNSNRTINNVNSINIPQINVNNTQNKDFNQYQQPINHQNLQSNNNKSNKKNIGIITIIVIFIVIGIIVVYNLKSSDSKKDNNINDSVKITGSVELLKEYEKNGYDIRLAKGFDNGPYFKYINNIEKWQQIIDMNGKAIFKLDLSNEQHNIFYIKDGYFIDRVFGDNEFQIIDYEGNKKVFNIDYDLNSYYNENILYYSYQKDINTTITQAYNLKTEKVLWEINGANPFVLENGNVVLQESKYNKKNKIVDGKTGETLIESSDDKKNIYITESCYYNADDNKIEIYNYNNELLSSYNLINNDNEYHELAAVLSTGGFVIKIVDKNSNSDLKQYKVFNKNGKEIMTFEGEKVTSNSLFTQPYGGGNVEKNSTTKYSFLNDNQNKDNPLTYIIYQDDTIIKAYKVSTIGNYTIGCVDEDCNNVEIINLETKEEKKLDEKLKSEFSSPINNSYFIVNASVYDSDNSYYVYNKNFEKIYSSKNSLYVVNDEYFLEVEKSEQEHSNIYLVNIQNLNKNLLDTNGLYDFHTANNIVTYEFNGNKQWLYKFK